MTGSRTGRTGRRGGAADRPRRRWLRLWATAADPRKPWVQWISIAAVLVGLITGVATLLRPDGSTAETTPAPSPLGGSAATAEPSVVGPLRVRNPAVGWEQAGEGIRQNTESMPTLEVSLLNSGEERVVFTGARFEVLAYGVLEVCELGVGAPLEVSATYDVILPLDPPPGLIIEAPMSQQLAGDEADRVAFRLGNPELGPTVHTGHLFLLDVGLVHGTAQSVMDAGTVLVSLPGSPVSADVGPSEYADPDCVQRNRALLADLTSDGVAVSAELAQLADDLAG